MDHFHTRDLDHSNGIIIVERSIRPRTSIEIRLQLFFSLHMYTIYIHKPDRKTAICQRKKITETNPFYQLQQ